MPQTAARYLETDLICSQELFTEKCGEKFGGSGFFTIFAAATYPDNYCYGSVAKGLRILSSVG